jgi:Cys-tRNA(Pro)/Cys-tRNA(Cys) deacylase
MAGSTLAVQALRRAGVQFKTHSYELGHAFQIEQADLSYGEAVAAVLGVGPDRLFKTLIAVCDGKPVVAIVPVGTQLSLKALAKEVAGKKAHLADPADAEKWTGYVVGGISPFGQKRQLPTLLDGSAVRFETIYVSAGARGLQVEVSPTDLLSLLSGRLAVIAD